jgi:hypothetical protein
MPKSFALAGLDISVLLAQVVIRVQISGATLFRESA